MSCSSIGIWIGTGNLYGFGRDIERVLVTWILYSFAIIIVTMVGMVGVLGKGLVTGILYGFDIDNEGICFKNFKLFWKR